MAAPDRNAIGRTTLFDYVKPLSFAIRVVLRANEVLSKTPRHAIQE